MAKEAKPEDLLKSVPFQLAFRSEDGTDAKTNILVSEKLTKKGDTPLRDLRTNGNLSPKYRFCFPGDSNTIPEDTSLGSYIASIEKNVTALRNADKQNTVATLTLSYRPNAAFRHETVGLSTEPADMSVHDWNVVMLNNSLLHGMVYDPESKTLQPAREPAFKLKRTQPDRYASQAGTTPTSVDNTDSEQFLGPAFEVADDSSVTFTSVRNSLQLSMIQNSFSSWSVEASAEGGFDGFSGGAKISGGQSSEDLKTSAMEKTIDVVHSSYNFPRVKVFLDGDDLEVSDVCKEFLLTEGRGFDGPQRFYRKFGTVFCCSVLLGARLHSTVEASSYKDYSEQKTKEEKKAAVSATFSSPFASGSAGASYANATEDGQGHKEEDKSGRMNWEARGGTTFLAVDPPSWINTVGMYQNWRVIERHGVKNIFNVGPRLMLFDGSKSDRILHILKNDDLSQAPPFYLIAADGRVLMCSSGGVISLIDPQANLAQGDSVKWCLVRTDSDPVVNIYIISNQKIMFYDWTNAIISGGTIVDPPFFWKVWQASPGSDLFFISCLDSNKTNWIALEVDTEEDSDKVLMKPLNIDSDNQVWRLLLA